MALMSEQPSEGELGARRPRRRLALGTAVAVAVALASLAGVAALIDPPSAHNTYTALVKARAAVARLITPPTRRWLAGDGQPATALALNDPVGLVEDRAGALYFVDRGTADVMGVTVGPFIWRLDPDGNARVIAGSGIPGIPEDGSEALAADLGKPASLALDSRERLYAADPHNHIVMRLEPDGRLTIVAGTGEPGYGGDGGLARAARLNEPYDVTLDAADNLYIADYSNHRIRKVTPEGTITTVAGTGTPGYAGDHGPAAQAQVNGAYGVRVHPDGRLLIADSGNHVVRQMTADGIITTLAGTGEAGHAGDGGPALQARFDAPESLFVDAAGNLYIGDEGNHTVRVVDAAGMITTLMGDGAPGYALVGQPAARAPLNDPESVIVRHDGSIVISDGDTGRVLTLDGEGKVAVLAGLAERTVAEALRLYRTNDDAARAAYEQRLRAAGLPQ
jgi:DNA-binding beta-propeller fold protein YncE